MIQTKKIILTLSCVLAGVFILTNWYYSGEDSIWFYLDKNTFFFFNHLIENNLIFRYIVAITNLRMFDAVGFLAMFLILFSYYLKAEDPGIVTASTEYGTTIHASVESGNVFGCQFHPEKSSDAGMKMLQSFLDT